MGAILRFSNKNKKRFSKRSRSKYGSRRVKKRTNKRRKLKKTSYRKKNHRGGSNDIEQKLEKILENKKTIAEIEEKKKEITKQFKKLNKKNKINCNFVNLPTGEPYEKLKVLEDASGISEQSIGEVYNEIFKLDENGVFVYPYEQRNEMVNTYINKGCKNEDQNFDKYKKIFHYMKLLNDLYMFRTGADVTDRDEERFLRRNHAEFAEFYKSQFDDSGEEDPEGKDDKFTGFG